ncbi:MAG: hypothetical protein JNK05_05360 [Myxococcales bacterium]|nr:hypothetical protein [Myxococcales bacterium]
MNTNKSVDQTAQSSSEAPSPATVNNAREDALAEVQPELASMETPSGFAYNIDPAHVIAVVQLAMANVESHMGEIGSLPTLDIKPIERLPLLALALWQADVLVENCAPDTSKFDADMEIARPLREELIECAQVLVRRKKLSQEQVDNIRSGLGHRDFFDDLAALVQLLKPFATVGGVVEPATLEQASSLADRLPLALAQRNGAHPALPALVAQRNKLGAMVVSGYDELRAALAFLRRKHGDADKLAPTLYVVGARSNKRDDDSAKNPANPSSPTGPVTPVTPVPHSGTAAPTDPSDRPFEDPR